MPADPRDYEGRMVVDTSGHRVGRVAMVYVDPESMLLQWALVRAGLLGRPTIVPLVQTAEDRHGVRIPHTREQIRLSPQPHPGGEAHPPGRAGPGRKERPG